MSCVNYSKIIESKTQLTVVDNFDNNENNWKMINNKNFLVENENGVLHIEKFEKNRISNGCLWYSKSFEKLDTSKDFSISFDARFISYDDIYNAFDFQWGNMDSTSYQLSVSIDGKFKLKSFNRIASPQLRWTDIAENEKAGLIKLDDFNHIQIIQIDGKCFILINKKVVLKTKINCSGKQIGFQECLKVAWELDNFKIRTSTN